MSTIKSVTMLFCLTRLGRLASSRNSSCFVENIIMTPQINCKMSEAQIENMITMSRTCHVTSRFAMISCFICEKLLAMRAKSRRPVANVFLVEYELNRLLMCVKSGMGEVPPMVKLANVVVRALFVVASIGSFSLILSSCIMFLVTIGSPSLYTTSCSRIRRSFSMLVLGDESVTLFDILNPLIRFLYFKICEFERVV